MRKIPAQELPTLLASGARALGLALDGAQLGLLLAYVEELERWNSAYNLTAVRDPAEMVTRHLLDSLAVLPAIDALAAEGVWHLRSLLDVGSGAGLPGLPWAVLRPQWQVALLDSNGKKARFLRHAQRVLRLENVRVIEGRVEAQPPTQRYDAVTSRAFASLADFVRATHHLLTPGGHWLALKGKLGDEELGGLPQEEAAIVNIVPLRVPHLDEQRHLVVMAVA